MAKTCETLFTNITNKVNEHTNQLSNIILDIKFRSGKLSDDGTNFILNDTDVDRNSIFLIRIGNGKSTTQGAAMFGGVSSIGVYSKWNTASGGVTDPTPPLSYLVLETRGINQFTFKCYKYVEGSTKREPIQLNTNIRIYELKTKEVQ